MRQDKFYEEENQKEIDAALQKIKKTEVYLDKVRGSLSAEQSATHWDIRWNFLAKRKFFHDMAGTA